MRARSGTMFSSSRSRMVRRYISVVSMRSVTEALPCRSPSSSLPAAAPSLDSCACRSLVIPSDLLPADGRFGCGPSKVRPEQLAHLAAEGPTLLGTSHRQAPVKHLVGRVRPGLADLFALPDGYEVVLGNGGSTAFWDAAAFGLIERRAQLCAFGEFGQKFAGAAAAPVARGARRAQGRRPAPASTPEPRRGRRRLRLAAQRDLDRRHGARDAGRRRRGRAHGHRRDERRRRRRRRPGRVRRLLLRARRRTSPPTAASGSRSSPPPRSSASSASPRADRYIPEFLSLKNAIDNSRLNQTLNTPALATLLLLENQLEWMNGSGGLAWADARTRESSSVLYDWAERTDVTRRPFVTEPADRSQVVVTIDFDESTDAAAHRVGAPRERHRRHRALPQARTQPAARRHLHRDRARRRARAHGLDRLRARADWAEVRATLAERLRAASRSGARPGRCAARRCSRARSPGSSRSSLALVFRAQLEAAGLGWWSGPRVTGVVLGLIGLVVVQVIRRRIVRQEPARPADPRRPSSPSTARRPRRRPSRRRRRRRPSRRRRTSSSSESSSSLVDSSSPDSSSASMSMPSNSSSPSSCPKAASSSASSSSSRSDSSSSSSSSSSSNSSSAHRRRRRARSSSCSSSDRSASAARPRPPAAPRGSRRAARTTAPTRARAGRFAGHQLGLEHGRLAVVDAGDRDAPVPSRVARQVGGEEQREHVLALGDVADHGPDGLGRGHLEQGATGEVDRRRGAPRRVERRAPRARRSARLRAGASRGSGSRRAVSAVAPTAASVVGCSARRRPRRPARGLRHRDRLRPCAAPRRRCATSTCRGSGRGGGRRRCRRAPSRRPRR